MASPKSSATTDKPIDSLEIDFTSRNIDLKPFPHPFRIGDYVQGIVPKTLIEMRMMHLSGIIRMKPKWYEKMKDETIRNKWKKEALEQAPLTEKQIDYVLAELDYYNVIRDNCMEMSVVDGVWQSDELISIDMKESLIECMKKFENIPDNEKDWHPGTNKQVLDLIHPSLFCFVNQTTRIINDKTHVITLDKTLEYIGSGTIIDINEKVTNPNNKRHKLSKDYTRSDTYQWLPAEFNVSKDGQVTIESYINNLHPTENQDLYRLIEKISERFIPLFNKVLTDLINNQNKPNRIVVDPYKWYKDSGSSDSSDHEYDYNEQRTLIVPDIGEFQMPQPPTTAIDLRGRKLQMIVKLANIILTPENPEYPGGVWHVEGMENEHIVATGIFYYSSSNITQSNLQFRTVIRDPDYEQDDHYGVRVVYGLNDSEPLNQNLGEIITQENRCIAFPNIYQHRVAPFQLTDPTKPGERKILVFFLVDPAIRILSTANVPPQQSHWLANMIRNMAPFQQLPDLVVNKLLSYIDFPMSLNEAKRHRDKLMNERKYFISQNNQLLFERPFSLCEH